MMGITEDRAIHMLGVARRCYRLAKEYGFDETSCKRAFMLGYLHDIGYEFNGEDPEKESSEITADWNVHDAYILGNRTNIDNGLKVGKEMWEILNIANMTVSPKGVFCDAEERLDEIKKQHGEDSSEYKSAKELCESIDVNTKYGKIKLIDLKVPEEVWLCGGDGTSDHRYHLGIAQAYEKGKEEAIRRCSTWKMDEPDDGQHIIGLFKGAFGEYAEDVYYNKFEHRDMIGWIPFPEMRFGNGQ